MLNLEDMHPQFIDCKSSLRTWCVLHDKRVGYVDWLLGNVWIHLIHLEKRRTSTCKYPMSCRRSDSNVVRVRHPEPQWLIRCNLTGCSRFFQLHSRSKTCSACSPLHPPSGSLDLDTQLQSRNWPRKLFLPLFRGKTHTNLHRLAWLLVVSSCTDEDGQQLQWRQSTTRTDITTCLFHIPKEIVVRIHSVSLKYGSCLQTSELQAQLSISLI